MIFFSSLKLYSDLDFGFSLGLSLIFVLFLLKLYLDLGLSWKTFFFFLFAQALFGLDMGWFCFGFYFFISSLHWISTRICLLFFWITNITVNPFVSFYHSNHPHSKWQCNGIRLLEILCHDPNLWNMNLNTWLTC